MGASMLALLALVAQVTPSLSVLSLRRIADFHCSVKQRADNQSQAFFEALFEELVAGHRPQDSDVSKPMALLPTLPMANASLTERLSPAWGNLNVPQESQLEELDDALNALGGVDGANTDNVTANSSANGNTSARGKMETVGTHEMKIPRRAHAQKLLPVDADAARVNASFLQFQCLFESMLSDHCGHLKSRDATRRGSWESVCLDSKHEHDSTDAYALMSAEERKYSRKIRQMTPVGRQTVQLWMENAQYKAILCMQMKVVDDGCLSFKEPRFLPRAQKVRSSRMVRGFVDSNKTRKVAKQLKPKVEIGTMSAGKDDAAKLVKDELEAVHHIVQ